MISLLPRRRRPPTPATQPVYPAASMQAPAPAAVDPGALYAVQAATYYAAQAAQLGERVAHLLDALRRSQALARRQYDRAETLTAELAAREWRTLPTLGGTR